MLIFPVYLLLFICTTTCQISFTEHVWWFWFIVFSKLFWNKTITWQVMQLNFDNLYMFVGFEILVRNVCTAWSNQQHLTWGAEEVWILFLSFVPGGLWRLDIYSSTLCTVTGHCTAKRIFAEIYNIVSNIFFQCFPHNIW